MEFILSNKQAAQKTEIELAGMLRDCFVEVEKREPTADEETGLREIAQCIKGVGRIPVTWSQAEKGIRGQTFNPARGPMGLFGDHG